MAWKISTTKTIEGILPRKPSTEPKKMMEEFGDPKAKKHAMKYAKLTKEKEEAKARNWSGKTSFLSGSRGKRPGVEKMEEIIGLISCERNEEKKRRETKVTRPKGRRSTRW